MVVSQNPYNNIEEKASGNTRNARLNHNPSLTKSVEILPVLLQTFSNLKNRNHVAKSAFEQHSTQQ